MDGVIILIGAAQRTRDENGVWRATPVTRQVFCKVESVTRSEYFGGGRNGLNPELVFTVFRKDYEGETTLEYEGNRFGIYRTYIADGDYIELYAERKGGTNGSEGNG